MVSRITYYVRMLAIYLLFITLFLQSGVSKLGPVPQWFRDTYGGTWLATIPGLPIAWFTLAALEILVVVIMVISLIRMEFLPNRGKDFMKLALMVAAVAFAVLGFGQHLVGEHTGGAELFFYFGATMATLLVVDKDHDAAMVGAGAAPRASA